MVRFEIFDARDLLSFPQGDNSSDTVFGGIHFNLTTLDFWNYTTYSNGTVSNGSRCWLTYEPYQPVLLRTNGSFVNATKCWSAVDPIGIRGHTGIGVAVAFALALVLTMTVLAKHGQLYLPKEKRFYPIGRRWQWYWGLFVCACALISLFTNIDVDRYHVQELPIIVTVFFWFLLCQGTTALVWEAVRHWGSWQERQYIDPNPFIYSEDDKRARREFWLPLWFYFWNWMNFFLVVPRSWKFAQLQRSPEQAAARAIPAATGARFKAGAFCLVVAWLTICYSLHHSIRHYKTRNGGIFNRTLGFVQAAPLRFVLIIPLCLALIAYQIFISFIWEYSIIKADATVPIIFGWGYGPALLILYIQVAYGYASPNEDKELIRQRRERGVVLDRELGITKKPAWWRRVRGDHLHTFKDKLVNNVNEVGTQRGTGRRVENDMERAAREEAQRSAINDDDIELYGMQRIDGANPRVDRAGVRGITTAPLPTESLAHHGKSDRDTEEPFAGVQLPSAADVERARRVAYLTEDGPPPPYGYNDRRRNNSTSTTESIAGPPQQVRSMLDI